MAKKPHKSHSKKPAEFQVRTATSSPKANATRSNSLAEEKLNRRNPVTRLTCEFWLVIVMAIILVSWLVLVKKSFIPKQDWALCCYGIIIVALYFSLVRTIRNLSPAKAVNEVLVVFIFLAVALMLILAFTAGWYTFDCFSYSTPLKPTEWISDNTRQVDAFYFSVTAFTTLGFGDILPVGNAGKLFLSCEALMGTTHMAAFLTLLLTRVFPPAKSV